MPDSSIYLQGVDLLVVGVVVINVGYIRRVGPREGLAPAGPPDASLRVASEETEPLLEDEVAHACEGSHKDWYPH